ncbi:MAG: NlpC/P60 family protein [Candidatus Kryptoniota bacterium]
MVSTETAESEALFKRRAEKALSVDPRYSVLEFQKRGGFFCAYVDSIYLARRLSELYEKGSWKFKLKTVILPDKSVGSLKTGVCHVGVGTIRKYPDWTSEQVTEVLYGESFDVLQSIGSWHRVRLHADGYLGWASANQTQLMDPEEFDRYNNFPKAFVKESVALILSEPAHFGVPLRVVVYGVALSVLSEGAGYLKVLLPNGETGYIEKKFVQTVPLIKKYSLKALFDTASRFLGVSYVWGGRSAKGFDCSGFIQTVFRFVGIELPRDASMQYLAGRPSKKNPQNLSSGDLVFFSYNGKNISHVGLYIGGRRKEFIHSSGYVKIGSFDRRSKLFDDKLFKAFVGACKVTI